MPKKGYKQTDEHKNYHTNKTYEEMYGVEKAKEIKKLQSQKMKGRKVLDKIIKKRTETRRKNGWWKNPGLTKIKQSESVYKRIMSGTFVNGRGRKGYFYSNKNQKNLFYRSFCELKTYEALEQDFSVLKYEVEPFRIPYQWKNGLHYYIPDILVTYLDGSQEIIEVKPEYKLKDKYTICKLKAGEKYALEKGLQFTVWAF